MSQLSTFTKSFLVVFGVLSPLVALLWSGPAAAGDDQLTYLGHTKDGYVRVRKSGNKDVIEVMKAPTVKARLECRADGSRIQHIGGQLYSKKATDWTRTWEATTEQLPSAAQIGAVCRQGHAAAMLPVRITAACRAVKTPLLVRGTHRKTPKIPFEVDCKGYGQPQRYALVHYWNPKQRDNVVIRSDQRAGFESTGYVRVGVVAQIAKNPNKGRRQARLLFKWNPATKGAQWNFSANQITREYLTTRDWALAAKVLGYVDSNPGKGRVALTLFWSQKRSDYGVAVGPKMTQTFIAAGYEQVGIEGYAERIRP